MSVAGIGVIANRVGRVDHPPDTRVLGVDSFRISGYANRQFSGDWYGTGILSYGSFDLRSSHNIAFTWLNRATGESFDADGLAGSLEGGMILECGKLVIRPLIALQYTSVNRMNSPNLAPVVLI
jgi:outer membrane autotransporter protein